MARIAVRHRPRAEGISATAATGLAAAGLALGATLGFLAGEFFGPRTTRAVRQTLRPVSRTAPSVAELVHDAQAALDTDVRLRELHLQVLPVGRDALELHGWVPDRRARALAGRLVAEAVTVNRLINCLLVRGEDDLPDFGDESDDEAVA
jgi:hypothetical protein